MKKTTKYTDMSMMFGTYEPPAKTAQDFAAMFGAFTPTTIKKSPVHGGGPRQGIGNRAYELIAAGLNNSEIVEKLHNEFPTTRTNVNCINWYRNKQKKSIN